MGERPRQRGATDGWQITERPVIDAGQALRSPPVGADFRIGNSYNATAVFRQWQTSWQGVSMKQLPRHCLSFGRPVVPRASPRHRVSLPAAWLRGLSRDNDAL